MAVLRIRHPQRPPADIDLGPAVGLCHEWDIVRRVLDRALTDPRKLERPLLPVPVLVRR
jgi:hypothetical protein